MRLHRLVIEGIGPYADRQEVDFDLLTAQGLFLLTGPTGAGKTTVLDAIVFALYGSVPGARAADGKRDERRARERLVSTLRSVNTEPRVELEFTVGGRRLLVTRSPDHERPKTKGSGTTAQRATATLQAYEHGAWKPVSTGFDEIGVELGDLLGMSAVQFSQVVLLPQGEFAGFLRAKIEDRRAVLERLFQVGAFQTAESWLRGQADAAAGTLQGRQAELDAVVQRLAGVLADDEAEDAPPPGAPAERVDAWIAAQRERTATLAASARAEEAAAAQEEREAQAANDQISRLVEARDALAERERALAEPSERVPKAREWIAARAGSVLAGQPEQWEHAAGEARERARELELLATEAAQLPQRTHEADAQATAAETAEREAAEADAAEHAAREAAARQHELSAAAEAAEREAAVLTEQLTALQRRATAMDHATQLAGRLAAAEAQLTEALTEQQRADAALAALRPEAELDADAATLRREREGLAAEQSSLGADRQRLERDGEQHAAERSRRAALEHEHGTLDHERITRRDVADTARAIFLEAKEARLDAMASELAAQLQHGEPCPVCGGTDHPAPAHGPGSGDLREREAAAQLQADEAARALSTVEQRLGTCRDRLAELDPAALTAREAELAARAAALDQAAAALGERDRELAAREAALAEAQQARRTQQQRCTAAQQLAAQRAETAAALRTEHATAQAVAGDEDAAELASAMQEREARLQHCRSTLSAAAAAREAQQRHEAAADAARTRSRAQRSAAAQAREAARRLRELVAERHAVLEAARGEHATIALAAKAAREHATALDGAAKLHARLTVAQQERDAAAELVAEREAAAAPAPGEPDDFTARVEARSARCEAASAAHRAAGSRRDRTEHCAAAVRSAEAELLRVRTESGPAAERAERILRLDKTVRGLGDDNKRRISLTTYVLAARLEEVAAAATNHLLRMSSGRYELHHHDERQGTGQAGLGLRVLDGWTGEQRDTATLSGGEAFYASLALALGLAEVVTQEAGGRPLDTLLVDEGFGSLDPDTLEEVLGELDGLRAAGRSIGLVSHVPALAERIPSQLRVEPGGRGGSTIRVVTGP